MKRAVSISIGSSKRNKAVEVTLLGEKVSIERIGTDGDMEKAAHLYQEMDGKVDAFGVGEHHRPDFSVSAPEVLLAAIATKTSRIALGSAVTVLSTVTNADGRTDEPLLSGDALQAGEYQLLFQVGDYFRHLGVVMPQPAFLESVPLMFGIADASAHYHVPLLCSPWAYSTYRGS